MDARTQGAAAHAMCDSYVALLSIYIVFALMIMMMQETSERAASSSSSDDAKY